MGTEWHIRRALPSDLLGIIAIEQACPEAPHWSHASWLEALAEDNSSRQVRASFVAEGPSFILGFAVARCAAELAELETVAVYPSARRQGTGKALIQEAMVWSREHGALSIELEVRASSSGARALYRLLGFAEQGVRRGYYQHPNEDAVLMAAGLQNEASLSFPGDALRRSVGGAKV
ncbi:MAG: GNAT family N-acetyltransferase [Acidobacteriaceae bacterium]